MISGHVDRLEGRAHQSILLHAPIASMDPALREMEGDGGVRSAHAVAPHFP